MSAVNTETGEIIERPTYGEVRQSVETTKTKLEEAAEQIVWQVENQVWMVLGYSSWDEMREVEYGGAAVIVPRADRPELSSRLRSQGLTQKSVADTLGVGEATVRRDNRQMADTSRPVTRTDSLGRERPTSYAPRQNPPTPEPTTPQGEPVSRGVGSGQTPQDQTAHDSEQIAPTEGSREGEVDTSGPAVADFVDSGEQVQNARYLSNFAAAMTRADDLLGFDAERVGRISDNDLMRSLDDLARQVSEFTSRARKARSGLRLINGK